MKNDIKFELLTAYFDIVSPLLNYENCDEISEIGQNVLAFLCKIKDSTKQNAECWQMIKNAECLQTCADVALFDSSLTSYDSVACDIKRDALIAAEIGRVKKFNVDIFTEELAANANMGHPSSCRLLAVMYWAGIILPQNKAIAQKIWSFLAMSGDMLAIEIIVNTNKTKAQSAKRQRWLNIKNILETEYNSFSAIATYSKYPDYTIDEVQTANIIMFMSQSYAKNGDKCINRSMIQYLLESTDDYETKMERISSPANYHLIMHIESMYANKEFGF